MIYYIKLLYIMNLEEHIKSWVLFDNQIKAYNDKIKEIRNKRSDLGDNIVEYMNRKHPNHSTIEISDGKLKLANTSTATPLSFKFVETCLQSYFNDDKLTADIMNHIKEKRQTKTSVEIKRIYSS